MMRFKQKIKYLLFPEIIDLGKVISDKIILTHLYD